MWNGKKKAVTFSFDDGVLQDLRIIAIMNKYGIKGTFNLNSGFLGMPPRLDDYGSVREVIQASKVKEAYAGHEVAAHTLTHPDLRKLTEETIKRQVEIDQKLLTELVGYDVIGMAYPLGFVSEEKKEIKVLKETTIRYARTVNSTNNFDLQTDLLEFNPTAHWNAKNVDELIDAFLATDTDKPQLLYLWGHTYEIDFKDERFPDNMTEEKFEKMCQKLAGREDIFYGTNKEVLL